MKKKNQFILSLTPQSERIIDLSISRDNREILALKTGFEASVQ